jgi:hypothetical protein
MMRFYNGDYHDVSLEAIETLLQISNVLNENAVYNDPQSALKQAIQNSLKVIIHCEFLLHPLLIM